MSSVVKDTIQRFLETVGTYTTKTRTGDVLVFSIPGEVTPEMQNFIEGYLFARQQNHTLLGEYLLIAT